MAVIDLLEVTSKKFIGRPLSSLYGKTGFNRFGYLLFLDEGENSKKLGEEYDFNRLMKINNQYADYIITRIERYYEQISIRISPPPPPEEQADV